MNPTPSEDDVADDSRREAQRGVARLWPMLRAEEYLARAKEAERMAQTFSGEQQQQMLDIAEQWLKLAEDADTSRPAP